MNPLVLSFGCVVAIAIVEYVLSWKWNRSYFTFGLPIFLRRVERRNGLAGLDLEQLQKRCATAAGAPMMFQPLGPDLIAFREKPMGGLVHYMPLMRGVIRHRPEESSVVVAGLVQWYFVALAVILSWGLRANMMVVVVYLGAALAILYLIQGLRFYRIANALRVL
jgi:hypothetical protein